MIDVWRPKKLSKCYCTVDNIISIVIYERDNCMTESFAILFTKNTEQREHA